MVGTCNPYFRNVKRKGKMIFDHSTTLREEYLRINNGLLMTLFILVEPLVYRVITLENINVFITVVIHAKKT